MTKSEFVKEVKTRLLDSIGPYQLSTKGLCVIASNILREAKRDSLPISGFGLDPVFMKTKESFHWFKDELRKNAIDQTVYYTKRGLSIKKSSDADVNSYFHWRPDDIESRVEFLNNLKID